jgi:hypothetical protein
MSVVWILSPIASAQALACGTDKKRSNKAAQLKSRRLDIAP